MHNDNNDQHPAPASDPHPITEWHGIIGDLKSAISTAIRKGEATLARKMESVLVAFTAFTPEEIIRMDEILD